MSLTLWQSRFENWLHTSWPQDDKAHDIAHFRRVWKTAQHIMPAEESSAAASRLQQGGGGNAPYSERRFYRFSR